MVSVRIRAPIGLQGTPAAHSMQTKKSRGERLRLRGGGFDARQLATGNVEALQLEADYQKIAQEIGKLPTGSNEVGHGVPVLVRAPIGFQRTPAPYSERTKKSRCARLRLRGGGFDDAQLELGATSGRLRSEWVG